MAPHMSQGVINLQPLIAAPPAIQIHVAAAVAALLLGALVLWRRKGTRAHRLVGRAWAALMLVAALSSFFISESPVLLGFGPIHVLSVMTLAGLAQGIMAIRAGDIAGHAKAMRSLYFFALIAAGSFTLLPGRRMHAVLLDNLPVLGSLPGGAMAAAFAGLLVALFFSLRRAGML